MSPKPKKILMPVSRFHELRWHVRKAFRGIRINLFIFLILAFAFLIINIAWIYIPELKQIRVSPYLEVHLVQHDGDLPASKIQSLPGKFDYVTTEPAIEIAGVYRGYSVALMNRGMNQIEIVTKVNDEIVSTERYEPWSVMGNYSGDIGQNIELPNLGVNRVEIQLNDVINSVEKKNLDVVTFLVKRETTHPKTPKILGAMKIDDSNFFIRGFVDPYVKILFRAGDNPVRIYTSDQWGYFLAKFQIPDVNLDQVEVSSENYAASSGSPSMTSEPVIINLSDLQNDTYKSGIETNFLVQLGYRLIAPKIQIKSTQNIPGLSDLLLGKTNNDAFSSALIGSFYINDSSRNQYFNNRQAEVKLSNEITDISFDYSSFNSSDFNYFGNSNLEIRFSDGFPLPGDAGKFQIQFADKQKYSLQTKPDEVDGNLYTWNYLKPGEVITITLERGEVAVSLRELGNLNPYEISGSNDKLNAWLSLWSRLLNSLPLLGLLWLFYFSKKMAYPKATFFYAKGIILFGLQILYIPMLYELFTYGLFSATHSQLVYFFYNIFDVLRINQLLPGFSFSSLFYDLSKITIYFIASIITSFLHIYFRNRSKYHVVNFLFTISNALGFLISLEIIGIVLSTIRELNISANSANNPSMVATILISGTVIYILTRSSTNVIQTIKHYFRYEPLRKHWQANIFILILFGLSVFLAVENFPLFKDSLNSINSPSLFPYKVQNILSRLSGIIFPYAFLAIVFIAIDFGRKTPWKTTNSVSKYFGNKILDLNSQKGWSQSELNYVYLGQILFAGFIVGTNDNLIIIPLSLFVGWFVYKYVLLSKPYDVLRIAYYEELVRSKRSELLAQLVNDLAIAKLQKKKDETFVNLASGKINPSEQEKIILALDSEILALQKSDPTPMGVRVRDMVLAFGPYRKPFDNAIFGLKKAFFVQLPLLFIFIQYYLFEKINSGTEYLWLTLFSQLIVFVSKWLILGFFFGLLYEFIRGNNGLRKSLFVAGAYALSLLPYRLITARTAVDFSSFTFEVGQVAIFLICLGLLMDWETLKKNGYRFSYFQVVVSDIPSLLSVSSIVITTVGVVITSLISGQLTQILNIVLGSILPSVTNLPFPPIK